MKQCITCKALLPLAAFHRNKKMQDGHLQRCKTCSQQLKRQYLCSEHGRLVTRRYTKRYTESGRAKISARRYEQSPKGKLARERYRKSSARKRTLRRYNASAKRRAAFLRHKKTGRYKATSGLIGKRWRKSKNGSLWYFLYNRSERGRATSERYRISAKGRESAIRGANKRRALEQSIEKQLTAEEWQNLKDQFHRACAYCGIPESSWCKLTRDHLVPLSKGGRHIASNVVPACQPCNSSKSSKLITVQSR